MNDNRPRVWLESRVMDSADSGTIAIASHVNTNPEAYVFITKYPLIPADDKRAREWVRNEPSENHTRRVKTLQEIYNRKGVLAVVA